MIKKSIHQIKTLGLENDQEAKHLLTTACHHVDKVMKRRNWTVPLVEEFIPEDAELQGLNENHGGSISIRLRRSKDLNSFYHYEHIVGTLLHELVHIEHGPHNKIFYKLLDQITNECENDGMPTSDSSNFFPPDGGKKLNDHRHNPSITDARQLAFKAVEKRILLSNLMLPTGGKRLGSSASNIKTNLTPKEAVALATIRRIDKINLTDN